MGICFLFAQKYHAAMKYVGPIRKELGIRTVFNILGPLTNPANPKNMILGVYDGTLVEPLARVLVSLGVQRGMVVYGECVLDELSCAGPTKVCEFGGGDFHAPAFRTYELTPEQFGMARCTRDDLRGGSPEENAQITRDILSGAERGCRRDTVVLNAAAGLYIAGAVPSLRDGVARANELIDTGAATVKLNAYIQASNAQ